MNTRDILHLGVKALGLGAVAGLLLNPALTSSAAPTACILFILTALMILQAQDRQAARSETDFQVLKTGAEIVSDQLAQIQKRIAQFEAEQDVRVTKLANQVVQLDNRTKRGAAQ